MATVTGLTAARMLAIEAASIVDGHIDGSGHLILTTQGGTEIDAGNAIGVVPEQDVVKYLDPAEVNQATLPVDYPMGVSLLYLTATDAAAGGWTSFLTKWGTVRTIKPTSGDDIAQIWMHHADETVEPEFWIRNGNWSGWGVWRRLTTTVDTNALDARLDILEVAGKTVTMITENSVAQSASIASYPTGLSIMSVTTGSGWTPNGGLGVVVTHNFNSGRVNQMFHDNDSPEHSWRRIYTAGAWSGWKKVAYYADDTDVWLTYNPVWTSSTPPAIGNGTKVGWYKQVGKTVHFKILMVFGTTTTYGTGAWTIGLPVTPHANMEGFVCAALGIQGANRSAAIGSYALSNAGLILYTSGTSTLFQSGAPLTWASTGEIRISGTYETA